MRAVYQALKVAAPAVLRVQAFPVCTEGGQHGFVPDDFAITEKVQVHRAPLQVDGVHCLASARLKVDGLLFWSAGKLAARDHKTRVCGVLNQLAYVQQETCLFCV